MSKNSVQHFKANYKRFLPLGGLFLVCLLYFGKLLTNKWPIPGDILTGMYFPWLDYRWGYIVRVPVKNPLISDVISQIFIWKSQTFELIRHFQLPLWDNRILSGVPLLASYQSGVFNPLNIFYLLFRDIYAFSLLVISQMLLSLLFMYFYLKEIKLKTLSAVFGAVIFSCSAFPVVWSQWGTLIQAGMYLPLIFFFLERYFRKLKFLCLSPIPFLVAFSVFSGHAQTTIYLIIASVIYVFFRFFSAFGCAGAFRIQRIKYLFLPLIVLCWGFIIASVQLLPTAELYTKAFRDSESYIEKENFGILPLKRLLTFVSPDFFGNPVTANFWGKWNYQETALYLGIVPLFFILIQSCRSWKGKNNLGKFYLLFFISTVLFIFRSPLAKLPFLLNFPFLSQSYASRAIYLLVFTGSILAALGFDSYSKKELKVKELLLLTATALSWPIFIFLIKYQQIFFKTLFLNSQTNLAVAWRNSLLPAALIGLSLIFLWLRKLINNKLLHAIIPIGFILILVLDLYRFSAKYLPFVKSSLIFPETPVISYLKKQPGPFRIITESDDILPANTWAYYGLESISGYNPLYPKKYAQIISLINTASLKNVSRYGLVKNSLSPIVDLLNVKYLITLKRGDDGVVKEEGKIPFYLRESKFKPVFQDGSLVVLENSEVLPRAFFTEKVVFGRDEETSKLLLSKDFVHSKSIILNDTIPAMEASREENCQDEVRFNQYSSNFEEYKLNSCQDQFLFISENYYSGWKAYLDGKETKIYLANHSFKAILIPKGRHQLQVVFLPISFKIGIGLSVLGIIVWCLILVSKKRSFF